MSALLPVCICESPYGFIAGKQCTFLTYYGGGRGGINIDYYEITGLWLPNVTQLFSGDLFFVLTYQFKESPCIVVRVHIFDDLL